MTGALLIADLLQRPVQRVKDALDVTGVHYRALAFLPRHRTTASQTSPRQSRQHLGELLGVGECLMSVVGVLVDIRSRGRGQLRR